MRFITSCNPTAALRLSLGTGEHGRVNDAFYAELLRLKVGCARSRRSAIKKTRSGDHRAQTGHNRTVAAFPF
jgi:hypothetical protein